MIRKCKTEEIHIIFLGSSGIIFRSSGCSGEDVVSCLEEHSSVAGVILSQDIRVSDALNIQDPQRAFPPNLNSRLVCSQARDNRGHFARVHESVRRFSFIRRRSALLFLLLLPVRFTNLRCRVYQAREINSHSLSFFNVTVTHGGGSFEGWTFRSAKSLEDKRTLILSVASVSAN